MTRAGCGVSLLAGCMFAFAAGAGDQRALVNYMLSCQGCHLPDGAGTAGRVPRLKDFVGVYLHSQAGREFIIRVPGVSTSWLSDAELSELMNWLVTQFSAAELPSSFRPYSAAEVGQLREEPETDPLSRRSEIITELADSLPSLSCYSDAWTVTGGC